jgi:uncharacterized protein YprB with RNaseH-like and TPR domain
MLSEDVRARLERLNRGRLPDLPATPATPPTVVEEPRAAWQPRLAPIADSSDRSLATLLPGEEYSLDCGPHYVVREALERFWPELDGHLQRLNVRLENSLTKPARRTQRHQLMAAFPRRTLFLDLETCGLAGAPIFLVGLIRATPEGLVLDQLLARNYAEERAILTTLDAHVADCDVLVTFNGRSFDWPMVQDRRVYHRMPPGRTELPHVDLLIHARKRWRTQVPNCRLQTLERFLCRRMRQGDIPGSQIPAAYHQFVRTGDARQLRNILHHNALDLVTLAQLTMWMMAEEAEEAGVGSGEWGVGSDE